MIVPTAKRKKSRRSNESFLPVSRWHFEGSDCDDPDVIRHVEVDNRVRKRSAEMAPRLRIKQSEEGGVCTHLSNEALDGIVESIAETWIDGRVFCSGNFRLLQGFAVKPEGLHRPMTRLSSARASSPGTPVSAPLSISAIRRWISVFHDC